MIVKYLERIPKEFVAQKSVEEVQAEVKKRFSRELESVSDEIIFTSENKPYKIFILMMIGLLSFWGMLLRIFY